MIIYPGRMLHQNYKRKLEKMKPWEGEGGLFFTKDSLDKVWVTKENFYSFNLIKVKIYANLGVSSKYFNPIPAGGGGGQFAPPPVVFLNDSKSIGMRLLKFSDFSYIPKALPLGLKPGINTYCLSPQAHCLNDCFCL